MKRIVNEFIVVTRRKRIFKPLSEYYNQLVSTANFNSSEFEFTFHFQPLEESQCFKKYIEKHYFFWQEKQEEEEVEDEKPISENIFGKSLPFNVNDNHFSLDSLEPMNFTPGEECTLIQQTHIQQAQSPTNLNTPSVSNDYIC